jgi:tRNA (guanosine-2'-O-)-methyltransferase
MNIKKKLAYKDFLKKFVTPARQEKILNLLPQRTRHVAAVLEDVSQSHNAAAIMRSCEALGVQNVYAIEQHHPLELKQNISQGAAKWLTLERYAHTEYADPVTACLTALKKQNYTLVGTSPHATITLQELNIDTKIALLFGTEETGLSAQAAQACDLVVALPQYGFVESLNVSVCAALCLYDLTTRLRASTHNWRLSLSEQDELELVWLELSLANAQALKNRFLQEYQD